MNSSSLAPANILVVDDTLSNLRLLERMLGERGYKVRPVRSGEAALRAARASAPDLILLDINMPGMNGYEICRQLKADESLRDIPVLFISALSETDDKLRAFEAGGVDYVNKPFQFDEVYARIRTHLELRQQRRQLEENYTRLRDLERLRDSLTHMIAHDMKSPLLATQLAIDLIGKTAAREDARIAELVGVAGASVSMLVELVSQMLDVSRMEAGKLELRRARVDLVDMARKAVDALKLQADRRSVTVSSQVPVMADVDADIVRRVLGNLVGNAIKFTPTHGSVGIAVTREPTLARVEVTDTGPGIAPEHHQRIFEKFGRVDDKAGMAGTGLGLTFARMAVEAHGGAIGVRSEPGKGSTFWFTLPADTVGGP